MGKSFCPFRGKIVKESTSKQCKDCGTSDVCMLVQCEKIVTVGSYFQAVSEFKNPACEIFDQCVDCKIQKKHKLWFGNESLHKQQKQYAENPYKMSPETREMYKSVGGTPFLDGDYTVFGEIVEGMDVLEKIALVATDSNDRPKEDVIILGTKLKRK